MASSENDKPEKPLPNSSAAIHYHDALTPERLDGRNYVEWSLNAQNKIRDRKRWGYVTGTKAAPKDQKSEEYETWEDENCLVKSWLLDSMTKETRFLFIRLATAKEIWETVKETYSVNQDASRAYQLYREVISTQQNGGSVITYFSKLQRLWQEYDAINDCTMECPKDVEKYNKMVNSQRVYVFLAGLDSHLDGVRGRILATTPLPNVQSVYATVCAEANRQEAMLGSEPTEGSVFSVKKYPKKGVRKCTHCNGDNHVVEACFKLHGYPDWHPKGKSNSSNKAENMKSHNSTAAGFVTKSGISNSALNLSVVTRGRDWIIDTGATDHMTCERHVFTNFFFGGSNSKTIIINANGVPSPIEGVGTVSLSPSLSISDVLFVPTLNCNLLSVSKLLKSHSCVAMFYPTHCLLQNIHTKEKIGSGRQSEGLYYLENVSQQTHNGALAHLASDHIQDKNKKEIWLWHKRLGHPSFSYLKKLFPSLFHKCNISDFLCETCVMAKSHRAVYPLSNKKTDFPFSLVHTDVWGPAPQSTHNGKKWFISFVDDCTRVTWVYLLKHKSDVYDVFRSFYQMIVTQFNTCIKVIRSDNGGEYFKKELMEFMNSKGILHQTTCPYSPQQNGVAERKNRHILEVTRSLLIDGNVPSHLWGEAVNSAVYLINRTPSNVLNFRRPLDVLSDHCVLPSIVHLLPRVFGCVIYVHLHPHQRTKFEERAVKCVFVGYGSTQKGYLAYHPTSKKFYISMDVTFHEDNFFFNSTLQGV
jgi:transposase InsO family protein